MKISVSPPQKRQTCNNPNIKPSQCSLKDYVIIKNQSIKNYVTHSYSEIVFSV